MSQGVGQILQNTRADGYLLGGVLNPTSSPTPAPRGSLYILVSNDPAGTIALFRKLDSGCTTNWEELTGNITINGNPVGDTLNLNFLGTGVTVVDNGGGNFDIQIPGTAIEKEELSVMNPAITFNFEGVGVLVTQDGVDPTQVNVEIPGLSGGGSPFNEKFYKFSPRETRADGSSSNAEFKGFSVANLSSGGISELLVTIPLINYQAGDDLTIDLDFIADNQGGGPNRQVDTELTIAVFQVGSDVDSLTDIITSDIYDVPNQEGLVYSRQFLYTAAQLGSLIDGDYFLKFTFIRSANSPQDNYNRNLHFLFARAFWEQ